ncbi:MAG: glycoside hydrolase family protein [Pseudomonadota bacterium]
MNRDALKALLLRHEGMKNKLYKDTQGIATIGVGRNLEGTGISEQEAMYLLENDMSRVVAYCRDAFPWFNGLDDSRQNVICSMVFNLGAAKFSEFKKMLAAVAAKDFVEAANQMLCSAWAGEVCARATELAQMMRDGDTVH